MSILQTLMTAPLMSGSPPAQLLMSLIAADYFGSGTSWGDSSGNNAYGTLVNSPAYTNTVPKHFSFDRASTEFVQGPAIGDFATWSIESWFRLSEPLSNTQATALITTTYEDGNGINYGNINYILSNFAEAGGNSNLTAGFYSAGAWYTTGGFVPTVGVWYHVVGTYDGTIIKQWVNGTLDDAPSGSGTRLVTATPISNGGPVRIARRWDGYPSTPNAGGYNASVNFFPGDVATAKIYDGVLSDQQIVEAYNTSKSLYSTYTFTPQTVSANEGSEFTFEIGGTNIVNGTYYWTVTNSGDFGTASGSFTITDNYGVITVTPTADATTEGSETFTVSIRSGSITGTVLATSSSITINDTSFAIGGTLSINGQTRDWSTTNATAPTYAAYTYPDNSSGSVHTLTGTQYVLSEGWGSLTNISVNLWFYPTANNTIIMGELGQSLENSGYHYSMLEINSSNYLKSRTWGQSGSVTSTGTVTLNAWNHVYFYFNNTTNTFSMSLNNETAVTQGSVNKVLSDTGYSYWGIGLTDSTNMGSSARYQGKFDALVIDSNLAAGSNYDATKAKYGF